MTVQEFRNLFPYFSEEKPEVYFDNAATSQRPSCVVDTIGDFMKNHNANPHRAMHRLSQEMTDAYESSREAVRDFLTATFSKECIFTSGTTASLNLVAYSFCERFVHNGDEIIVGEAEHHSNFVPWQLAVGRRGAKIVYWRMSEDGSYSPEELERLIGPKTRLVCVAHASNVLGRLNPVKEITALCHSHGVPCLVDGAQGAVHCKVDVNEIDCDFYAFSLHKMFGPTGVGVLYGKKKWLEEMPPFLAGGEMVGTVSMEHTDYAQLPLKFEAGTPNFTNVAGVKPALELLQQVISDVRLNDALDKTAAQMRDYLLSVKGLHLYGDNIQGERRLPVFSFSIDGVHHEDLAILLDKMNVAVRSGQMCAEPLMRHFGVSGMVRASLLWYNDSDDVNTFAASMDRAISILK